MYILYLNRLIPYLEVNNVITEYEFWDGALSIFMDTALSEVCLWKKNFSSIIEPAVITVPHFSEPLMPLPKPVSRMTARYGTPHTAPSSAGTVSHQCLASLSEVDPPSLPLSSSFWRHMSKNLIFLVYNPQIFKLVTWGATVSLNTETSNPVYSLDTWQPWPQFVPCNFKAYSLHPYRDRMKAILCLTLYLHLTFPLDLQHKVLCLCHPIHIWQQ